MLPLIERAKLKCLPDYLSITELVQLYYPDPDIQAEKDDIVKMATLNEYRKAMTESFIDYCLDKDLEYEGHIYGLTYSDVTNGSRITYTLKVPYAERGSHCLIHKNKFEYFLKSQNKWPTEGLLANWWPEYKPKQQKNNTELFGIGSALRASIKPGDVLKSIENKNPILVVAFGTADETVKNDIGKPNHEKLLIPLRRNRTELLDLIYKMFKDLNIKVGDKQSETMSAIEAWGKLISSKYKTDLIKNIEGKQNIKSIELNCGVKVFFRQFSNTYNRRFK